MAEKKAIVTLALGEKYVHIWDQLCKENWQIYAEKYGYDLICLKQPLDQSPRAQKRSPAWQKCLVLNQPWAESYDRIVWVDADILINVNAPDITQGVPLEKVGVVDEWAWPTPEIYRSTTHRRAFQYWTEIGANPIINHTPEEWYANYGLPPKYSQVVQTGVMVMSPKYHNEVLKMVYDQYEDKPYLLYEMRPLSFELLENNLVHWLDIRFNVLWFFYKTVYYPFFLANPLVPSIFNHQGLKAFMSKICLEAAYINSYFIHFAGDRQEMSLLNWRNLDFDTLRGRLYQ
ncbi:hypothetical protein JCM14036_28350 [Desulfotomaculum defluvii]